MLSVCPDNTVIIWDQPVCALFGMWYICYLYIYSFKCLIFEKIKTDAARVISEKHELQGCLLQLRYLRESLEKDYEKNKLIIHGIPVGLDEDHLQLFLDRQLQLRENDFSITPVVGGKSVISFVKECSVDGEWKENKIFWHTYVLVTLVTHLSLCVFNSNNCDSAMPGCVHMPFVHTYLHSI